MVKSSKSLERIFKEFEGKNIADIAIIQSAYSTKNYEVIRKTLGKSSSVSNAYLMGLGRFANQYVNALSNPTKNIEDFMIKHYKSKPIKSVNPSNNLINNISIVKPIKATKKGKKSGGGSVVLPDYFLAIQHTTSQTAFMLSHESNKTLNRQQFLRIFSHFIKSIYSKLKSNPFNLRTARISIKYKTNSGQILFISSRRVNIKNYTQALKKIDNYFNFKYLRAWQQLSPGIGSIIEDFGNTSDSIAQIIYIKTDYRI